MDERTRHLPGARALARLGMKAGLALALGLAILALRAASGPWSAPVSRAVAWSLSTRWQTSPAVRRAESHLIAFVESRTWGAFLDFWNRGAPVRMSRNLPVAWFRVKAPFGWVRTAQGYRFDRRDLLVVRVDRPVLAPAPAHIVRYRDETVVLRTANGTVLTLFPVRLLAHRPARVVHGTRIGLTAARTLQLGAERAGIPVKPGGVGLYTLRSRG
ncbi:MAG: hypothetical protein ACP5QO_10825 [Clostridia bacterium]